MPGLKLSGFSWERFPWERRRLAGSSPGEPVSVFTCKSLPPAVSVVSSTSPHCPVEIKPAGRRRSQGEPEALLTCESLQAAVSVVSSTSPHCPVEIKPAGRRRSQGGWCQISRRGTAGFVLLEVIVAMVILGISIATIMRSFTLSLAAIHKNDASTQATVLAETALQSMEAEPPGKGKSRGDFEADGFPRYSYDVVSKKEELKYRLKTKSRPDNLRELQMVNLKINYDDPRGKVTHPAEAFLILTPLERFSYEAKLRNELFSEEEGI